MRPSLSVPFAAALALVSNLAHADDTVAQCSLSYRTAQEAERAGRLRDAVRSYLGCRREGCPADLVRRCSDRQLSVESRIPTVVFVARDQQDRDVSPVSVYVDGAEIADATQGKATPLDPGERSVRFLWRGNPPREVLQKVRVVEGEKNRRLLAIFDTTPASTASATGSTALQSPPPVVSAGSRVSPFAYIFTGVTAASLGTFLYFALRGVGDENAMRESCSPRCPQADIDAVKTKYLVADIMLGVSLASAGVATYFFLARKTNDAPTPAAGMNFAVAPLRDGFAGTIGGRF